MAKTAAVSKAAKATWLPWLTGRVTSVAHCLLVCVLAVPGLACGLLALLAEASLRFGAPRSVVLAAVRPARGLAEHRRGLVRQWTGRAIDSPYGARPPGREREGRRALDSQATRRDSAWLLLDPFIGGLLTLLPLAAIVEGAYGLYLCLSNGEQFRDGYIRWYPLFRVHKGHTGPITLLALLAVSLVCLGLWYAPKLLDWYGRWAAVLLAPTETARLSLRVRQLTETRAGAVNAQAAELVRIERDLHDGAQARLVGMGMSLGAAVQLMDKHPEEAKAMLLEARDASARALAELRDLVHGIRPPVLADRGLRDAVRALALDCPFPVELTADLPGRPDAPVESAAYFAVAEALANVAKHAGARQVRIDIWHGDSRLRLTIADDGGGGADPARGGGLRGIERRLAPFDGVLAVSSPVGGPTIVNVEIPCALS
jgi:signal transduction histidine kinase